MDHGPRPDRQKRTADSYPTSSWYQPPWITYDNDTGQVYTERVVRAPRKQRANWINEYKTASLVKRRQSNTEGAASLFDMAKAKVAGEMRSLTASHLEGLPLSTGRKLWDEVEDSRLHSFHTWRIFVSAFPEIFHSPRQRYFLDIKELITPLTDYLAGLDSASISWLSCLRVNPHGLDRADLVRIGQLQNVAVLDLSDDVSTGNQATQMDERIFKTWSEMAEEGQAFKHLRVLLMRGQGDVAAWIFRYLDAFPSLCFLILSDCGRIHQKNRAEWTAQATSYGWGARHAKKSARSLRHLINDEDFHLGSVSTCYYHSKDAFDGLATKRKPSAVDRLPVVEAWIGQPKPWLHLIEEFPGTRTVWFDNTKTKEAARKAEAGRTRTEGPAFPKVVRVPLAERIESPQTEESTKRTRDMLTSPGVGAKPPPHKRTTMMPRSRAKNLDRIMAEFGRGN